MKGMTKHKNLTTTSDSFLFRRGDNKDEQDKRPMRAKASTPQTLRAESLG